MTKVELLIPPIGPMAPARPAGCTACLGGDAGLGTGDAEKRTSLATKAIAIGVIALGTGLLLKFS